MEKSRRIEKINEQIKTILSSILHEVIDKTFGVFSITIVDTSPDMHHCKVFVSSFSDPAKLLEELDSKKHTVNKKLASKMTTKFTPKIRFYLDDSIEYADKISRLIDESKRK